MARGILAAACYLALVVAANFMTEHLGLVPIGFGLLVTAGTFAAGGVIITRNVVQDVIGRRLVVALMAAGSVMSWWLASPAIAVASTAAFALSETTDMGIFTPLRRHGWPAAVAIASTVAAVVDTLAFLALAGFPITWATVGGQLIVKTGMALVAAGGARAVLRHPVNAEGA